MEVTYFRCHLSAPVLLDCAFFFFQSSNRALYSGFFFISVIALNARKLSESKSVCLICSMFITPFLFNRLNYSGKNKEETLTSKAFAIFDSVSVSIFTGFSCSNLLIMDLDTPDFSDNSSCVIRFSSRNSLILYFIFSPFTTSMLSGLNNFVKPTKQKYLKNCLIRYTIKSQKGW